jgi:hypothetical protein
MALGFGERCGHFEHQPTAVQSPKIALGGELMMQPNAQASDGEIGAQKRELRGASRLNPLASVPLWR